MEIEPHKPDLIIPHISHQFLELGAQHFLRSLFVHQVQNCNLLKCFLLVLEVCLQQRAINFVRSDYRALGRPLHVGLLLPLERHRPSCLHVGKYVAGVRLLRREYLFCLHCVDRVPLQVNSSADPPGPLPSFIPSRDDDQLASVFHAEREEVIYDHPTNKPRNPLVSLSLDELLHPDLVVEELTVPFVHLAVIIQELLEGFSEVVIVTVVELLQIEESL